MIFLRLVRQWRLVTPRSMVIVFMLALASASCTHSRNQQASQIAGPGKVNLQTDVPQPKLWWREKQFPVLQAAFPQVPDAEYVNDDELCMTCHESYAKSFAHNVHRGQNCEDCHGPASRHLQTRGKEPGLILNFKTMQPAQRSEVCLKCHENDACSPAGIWRTSVHAHKGVACTDCHHGHYNVPPGTPATSLPGLAEIEETLSTKQVSFQEEATDKPPLPSLRGTSHNLGAVAPEVCYICHKSAYQLQAVAGPHQIGGPNGFNCTTCHDPHGKILDYSRKDLCLKCHDGSPTAAWHSSTHEQFGVACTDCHNPHAHSTPQQIVDIKHTNIKRPKRMPMSVNDPDVCFKCHPKIFGLTRQQSHHPIREGKMFCADCHDPHGQYEGGLKNSTVNMVCYKCHADKQGPFVYEHPPVTENCDICHNPHGTVANNLLRQPTTFLCLRCHTGHRTGPNFGPHIGAGLIDVGTSAALQKAFYSDCSQCHNQIHGSDLPSPHNAHAFFR